MTNSSAEASGPSGARSMPGAFTIVRTSSPLRPLVISVSDPDLRIMTRRSSPFSLIAARKPSAIDSTEVKTITTPATPITATADEPSRCEIDLSVTTVTARICENAFIVVSSLRAPERRDDLQPLRLQRRQESSTQSENHDQHGAE